MPLEVSRCGRFFRRPFDDEPLPEEKDKAQCCKWAWQQAVCLAKVCLEGTGNVGGSKTLFDPTVYTGTAGLAVMCLELAKAELANNAERDYFETQAMEYWSQTEAMEVVWNTHSHLRKQSSIVCGKAGSLLAGIYVQRHFRENVTPYVIKFCQAISYAGSSSGSQANEFLYGRAGSLYGVLNLRQLIREDDVPAIQIRELDEEIRRLSWEILYSGRQYAKQYASKQYTEEYYPPSNVTNPPLFWEFHGKPYIGLCHGALGILGILLQVPKHIWGETSERQSDALKDIIDTLDFLVESCWNNEKQNFPTRLGSSNYDLVQWCHGASGAVLCFATAFEATRSQKYLDAAIHSGEVVWERGLLTKGPGLCHGISGNAYAFLALYHLTGQEKYLRRAYRFAQFITESVSSNKSLVYRPDHPFSLFEGLAGAACLLVELSHCSQCPKGKLCFYSLSI